MEVNTTIREETQQDYKQTESVIEKAFANLEISDHREHLLIAKLRASDAFVPRLSLVADSENGILGHVLFCKVVIEKEEQKTESLALACVSVLPEYQNRSVGTQLIRKGIKKATEMGYQSVIVVGHPSYYPRFGFQTASQWGIKAPFECPEEALMALELVPGSLSAVSGTVIYPKEFLPE